MILYGFHYNKCIFTEWDVTITYAPYDNDRRYKIYNCKLIRKIPEALAAENNINPTKDVDYRLRNRINKFFFKEIEWTNIDTFRFGKYCGKKIADVHDIKYTCWYFEQNHDINHQKYIEDFLYDNWCDIRTLENGKKYAVTHEIIKKEEEQQKKQDKVLNKANNMERVYLNITHNPDSEGRIIIDDVTYIFPKVKEYYYEGNFYYLPVKNGKAKRIKGKMIEAVLMNLDNEIFISNFEIIK